MALAKGDNVVYLAASNRYDSSLNLIHANLSSFSALSGQNPVIHSLIYQRTVAANVKLSNQVEQ